MFKVYTNTDKEYGYYEYYVGETADIKALYKSIRRNKYTNLIPLFVDCPKFSENKSVYALCIKDDKYVSIVNSDTMLSMIITGEVKERRAISRNCKRKICV